MLSFGLLACAASIQAQPAPNDNQAIGETQAAPRGDTPAGLQQSPGNVTVAANETAISRTDYISLISTAVQAATAVVVAMFTIRLWSVARLQQATAARQVSHIEASERAYIVVAPVEARWDDSPPSIRMKIQSTNKGKSIATICGGVASILVLKHGETLPTMPPYPDEITKWSFILWAHEPWAVTAVERFEVSLDEWPRVRLFADHIYLFGFIDYRDVFGSFWRVGWGREWNIRHMLRDQFDQMSVPHYSYQRRLTDDESRRYSESLQRPDEP